MILDASGGDQRLNPVSVRSLAGRVFRDGLANPGWALTTGMAVLRARWDLRHCQQLGARPRLFGRCMVANYGDIRIGDRLLMYGGTVRCELTAHAGGRLEIGNRAFINYGCSISAHQHVRIGDGCLIGQYGIIMDCDYHSPEGGADHGVVRPIWIGDRAWIGARVIILKGVTIGSDAVIAAGSVVTRDVPANAVAAGVPAAVVRMRA